MTDHAWINFIQFLVVIGWLDKDNAICLESKKWPKQYCEVES